MTYLIIVCRVSDTSFRDIVDTLMFFPSSLEWEPCRIIYKDGKELDTEGFYALSETNPMERQYQTGCGIVVTTTENIRSSPELEEIPPECMLTVFSRHGAFWVDISSGLLQFFAADGTEFKTISGMAKGNLLTWLNQEEEPQ